MKAVLFLERKELATSIQKFLQLPYVQMIHSEDLFKQNMLGADQLVAVHKKILDENTIQQLNRFFLTKKGARMILFYDVLLTQTPSLFPIFSTSFLFEKRRDVRSVVQIVGVWRGEKERGQVEIQNVSGLGALVRSSTVLNETLGVLSFQLAHAHGVGDDRQDFHKYWGKIRWKRNLAEAGERSDWLYGLYFVAQAS